MMITLHPYVHGDQTNFIARPVFVASLLFIFCQPARADFELTLEAGSVATFGSAEFSGGSPDRNSTQLDVTPGSKSIFDSGSTSTGGVDGDVEASINYSVGILDEGSPESRRTTFNVSGTGQASAYLASNSVAAFASISAATADNGDATGSPIVLRLESDNGPVRFNVLNNSASPNAFFSISPDPGTSGLIEPGDYLIDFRIGAFISEFECPENPPNCNFDSSSNFDFTMELFVPEPTSMNPMALVTVTLVTIRRRRKSHHV